MGLIVLKKTGNIEDFNADKIKSAVKISASRAHCSMTEEELNKVVSQVLVEAMKLNSEVVKVSDIHTMVMDSLKESHYQVYRQYKAFRDYKSRFSSKFMDMAKTSMNVVFGSDKENANKNSSILSTQKEILAGQVSEAIMTECELDPEAVEAHKSGRIHIHDIRDRLLYGINCNLFDMSSVLRGGFEMNGVELAEPKRIETAYSVVSNIITNASGCQYGGFTVPEVDKLFAPYVRKTKELETEFYRNLGLEDETLEKVVNEVVWNKTLQSMESLEYELNLVNTPNGQTTFITFTGGLDTTEEGRMVWKAILLTRLKKMGTNKITAIFPKLVFLHRNEINGLPDSPNYDLKKLAIKCSMSNLYPDWLSLDEGYLGDVYNRCGKAISPMGCRAFLSPWVDENGEEQYVGRFNIGAVTLNFPRLALEANGDLDKFYELMYEHMEMAFNVHEYTYAKMSKKLAASNPLFFTQGGCIVKLKPEDTIEEALKVATASFGYIGLTETCYLLSGKPLHENIELCREILQKFRDKVDEYKEKSGRLYAMYATPAESLCRRFLSLDREKFGVVPGVTDKEWYTNSHHVGVEYQISSLDKIDIESYLFDIPTGGRIMYTEWQHTDNEEAVEQVINYAMHRGLYFGINFENSTCGDCGAEGEFKSGICHKCGSSNVTTIDRVCGYLGISNNAGDSRYNEGKRHEVLNRVKHYNVTESSRLVYEQSMNHIREQLKLREAAK